MGQPIYTDLEVKGDATFTTAPVVVQVNKTVLDLQSVQLPQYETSASAGMDVRAVVPEGVGIIIEPGKRALIKTGLFVAIPEQYEIQVRSRSGLAYKNGVVVLNAPGTIDADYRGEIGAILINLGDEPFTVANGDRIAQLVLAKHERISWDAVSVISTSGVFLTGILLGFLLILVCYNL